MPATLQQIQARLEQAVELHNDAAEFVQSLALGGTADEETRIRHVSKLQGYRREVELLQKIERDLISQGRADENDLRVLSGFDAPQPETAAVTLTDDLDAQKAPRETPRSEASTTPLPPAGDVF